MSNPLCALPPLDLRTAGVDCVTLGQYMQPTRMHLKVCGPESCKKHHFPLALLITLTVKSITKFRGTAAVKRVKPVVASKRERERQRETDKERRSFLTWIKAYFVMILCTTLEFIHQFPVKLSNYSSTCCRKDFHGTLRSYPWTFHCYSWMAWFTKLFDTELYCTNLKG